MSGKNNKRKLSLLAQSSQLRTAYHKQNLNKAKQTKSLAIQQKKHKEKKFLAAKSPYRSYHTILTLGEGNFSFSKALTQIQTIGQSKKQQRLNNKVNEESKAIEVIFNNIPAENITATCYDSFDELNDKYPQDAMENVSYLQQQGMAVLAKIDCLHLENYKFAHNQYDRVIFNFPHTGCGIKDTARNNALHKLFLKQFFESLIKSRIVKSIKHNGEIHITLKQGEPYSSWNIVKVAREVTGIKFKTSFEFYPHLYPNYQHRRTIGNINLNVDTSDNADIQVGANTYVFTRENTEEDDKEYKALQEQQALQALVDAEAAEKAEIMANILKYTNEFSYGDNNDIELSEEESSDASEQENDQQSESEESSMSLEETPGENNSSSSSRNESEALKSRHALPFNKYKKVQNNTQLPLQSNTNKKKK
jgi:25S rRNA (uracil2634-N3)-methyltransferase